MGASLNYQFTMFPLCFHLLFYFKHVYDEQKSEKKAFAAKLPTANVLIKN